MTFSDCCTDLIRMILLELHVCDIINMSEVNMYCCHIIFDKIFIRNLMIKLITKLTNLKYNKYLLSPYFDFDIQSSLEFIYCIERSHPFTEIGLYLFDRHHLTTSRMKEKN